jgi:hypothetical protein
MKTISTSDLQFAAFIKASGYDVTRIEGPAHRRSFVFEAVPADIHLRYYQDRASNIGPRSLFNAYHELKRQAFIGL